MKKRIAYYVAELTQTETAFKNGLANVNPEGDYFYEGPEVIPSRSSVLVYKKTPFTAKQIAELECTVESSKIISITEIDTIYTTFTEPKPSVFIGLVLKYGNFMRDERKFRKSVMAED
jgi:hypothetical protein